MPLKVYDTLGKPTGASVAADIDADQVIELEQTLRYSTVAGSFPSGAGSSIRVYHPNTTAGRAYIADTMLNTDTLSADMYIYFDTLATVETPLIWFGYDNPQSTGAVRSLAVVMTAAGQIRLKDSTNADLGGGNFQVPVTAGTLYRIALAGTPGAGTGTARAGVYTANGTVVKETGLLTGVQAGPTNFVQVRQGKAATSSSLSNFYFATPRYNDSIDTLLAPPNFTDIVNTDGDRDDVEPGTLVTLNATTNEGTAAWTQVSGPGVINFTASGNRLTYTAPSRMAPSTNVFRATKGTASKDVSVTYLPSTEARVIAGVITPALWRISKYVTASVGDGTNPGFVTPTVNPTV